MKDELDKPVAIRIGSDGRAYHDYDFEKVVAKVKKLTTEGHRCYQKFSCEKCDNRLGIDRPNTFYEQGSCDNCGHITNIRERGCNYTLVMNLGAKR